MKSVLVLEDDEKLRHHLLATFSREGFSADAAATMQEMRDCLSSPKKYDSFILDRMIQTEDAQEFIPHLRRHYPRAAIIILSAVDTPTERANMLDLGADDYVGKPFSLVELMARLKAQLRKSGQGLTHLTSVGNTVIDSHNRSVSIEGKTGAIPAKEFLLLRTLAQSPGRVYSREELLDLVWGIGCTAETNVAEATITNLRKRLSELGSNLVVRNSRNQGYWIES